MPEHDEREQSRRKQRQFRLKIGWYALPALMLLAVTGWLLANMAGPSGGALVRVLLGIAVVLGVAALVYKAVDRATNVD